MHTKLKNATTKTVTRGAAVFRATLSTAAETAESCTPWRSPIPTITLNRSWATAGCPAGDSADISALKYAEENSGFIPVNLGTGKGSSVLDVVAAYERACGKSIPVEITQRRSGDIAVSYADTSLAKKLFNWEAKMTVDDMCRDSWNFTLNNPDGL